MRSFQRCHGYCTRIKRQFLHTFADAFQECYKNGTNGTHDYRYFAGLYLLFQIVLLAAFISPMSYADTGIPFPVIVSLVFAYSRLDKNTFFNIIDGLAFVLLDLALYVITRVINLPIQILFVIVLIPFLCFISFILYGTVSYLLQQVLGRNSKDKMITTYSFIKMTTLMRIFTTGW